MNTLLCILIERKIRGNFFFIATVCLSNGKNFVFTIFSFFSNNLFLAILRKSTKVKMLLKLTAINSHFKNPCYFHCVSSNHSLYPALLLWVSYPGTGHGSDLHRNIFHHFASPFNTWRMHKFGRFALNFVRDYDHTSAHIFPLRHIENRPRLRSLDVCGIAQGI